ncbi:hypothetical protein BU17DRAFT_99514 [Hysterangium stoloniferum]|nr:hypothetical protein BU17DRAFT_99514 [Hysterangium stoloniferum]
MSELPQRAFHRPPVLLPPPGKTAAPSMLVKSLPHLIEEGMRVGPSERNNPVAEMLMGWRWTPNWSGERSRFAQEHPSIIVLTMASRFYSISSVLAMLLVALFDLTGQGLTAVTRHHHAVALDIVRPTTTTTSIDELMGKCALRTKAVVIGRHVPAVAEQGMISQLSSAKIDVIELKRTDNGLANGMRSACVSFAKPVSQSSANLVETPLGPRMQIDDNPLNGPQSKSATLTTSKKWTRTHLMWHTGADGSKDPFPFAATKYNQTPEVACCLPAVDRRIHLELLIHNACDRLPDAAGHVLAATVHMSWFCPSHRDCYLKSQQAVTNNPQWLSLGAHLETAGNRGVIGIVIPDDPEEDGPAEAPENARSLPTPVPWFCCKNVITATTLHAATGDVGFCSSHKDSDLKPNRIIGNRTWLMSPVDMRSGRIGRWFFGYLDKPALIIEAILPRGTARYEGVQASMAWREETGSSQSMRLHTTQVTYAMKHNHDKYPPSKNRFKGARAGRCMRHKRMRQATDGYGGYILGDGFSWTSFGDAAAVVISTSKASVTVTEQHRITLYPRIQVGLQALIECVNDISQTLLAFLGFNIS